LQFNCSHRRLVHAFSIYHLQQKHIQVIKLITKRSEIYKKNCQAVKKEVWSMQKKRQHKKSCEIQGGGPEGAVMVG